MSLVMIGSPMTTVFCFPLLWSEIPVQMVGPRQVTVIFRMLFDHLCDDLLERLQRLAIQPFLPAGLKKASKLLTILSEHRARRSLLLR